VLLVSHDRAFINNIVTSCLVFRGDGEIEEFVGSYDDWQVLNPSAGLGDETNKNATKVEKKTEIKVKETPAPTVIALKKMNYQEKRELELLPKEIEQLEQEVEALHQAMAASDFYQQDHKQVTNTTETLKRKEALLEKKYARWEELEG
jgi:ATP-binding cassette subfamily F protein uup